jgi:outer membrane receptor protein involved in Fe transport
MKKINTLLIFLGICIMSKAQTITGVVAGGKDKSPIEFASVAIINLPDSTIVSGKSTQTGGLFAFEKVKPGNYFAKASFVGYKSAGKQFQVNSADLSVNIDTLTLEVESKQIDDVVVTGDKIKGTELVDRTVYSIPYEVSKTSPNAYDLLKKVPSIQVDYNDNITLNGSSNFIIQVDGKQRDKEYLARLQPSDIETIEVVTNPSGKYEGNIDGVINILLKREARYGFGGNLGVNSRPATQTSSNVNGAIDYSMGNATIYLSGFGLINNLSNDQYNYTNMILKDSTIDMHGKGNFRFLMGSINTGVDYYIDKKRSFSFNLNYKPVSNNNDLDQNSTIISNSINTYLQSFNSENLTNSNEVNSSIFYKQQFEKPAQELSIEGNYYYFNSADNNSVNNTTFQYNNVWNVFDRWEKSDNTRNSIKLKADYTHPFGFETKVDVGFQLYNQTMDFDASYSYNTLLNNYLYTEFRSAAYTGISSNFDKLGLQATLRIENSNVQINKDTTDNYYSFLPSANIQYKFTSKQNAKLTYNRRINRPNIYQLNPFEKVGFKDDISVGNKSLKPELRDKIQLTYTLNIQKSYVSPYIYYETFTDKISNMVTTVNKANEIGKTTQKSMPFNVLSGYEQGIGLNAMILFLNINFKYFKGHYNEYENLPARDFTSYSISGWAFAPLPKEIKWFAFANYGGVNTNAQGTSTNPFFYGTGLRREFGNHTIGVFYLLPFTSKLVINKSDIKTESIVSTSEGSFNSKYFIQLQYSYKFNKGKAIKKVARNTEVESDTKKEGLQ